MMSISDLTSTSRARSLHYSCSNAAVRNLSYPLAIILCFCSCVVMASNLDQQNPANSFYSSNRIIDQTDFRARSPDMIKFTSTKLKKVLPSEIYDHMTQSDQLAFENDDDLLFNYLWLEQHQQHYKYRTNGGAAKRLLRRSVESLYKADIKYHGNSEKSTRDLHKKELNHGVKDFFANDLSYRLRLRTSIIKVGVEYEF